MRMSTPRWVPGFALAAGICALLACEDTVDPCNDCPPPPPSFQDLTEPSDVLNNLELAYNKRMINRYDELLDVNFTFFLTPGDVGGGLPENWGRADELQYNSFLFDATPPAPFPRCKSVQVDIQWEDNLQWVEIPSPGPPIEKWYMTTVFYDFKFEMEPDNTYLNSPGSKAQFTVRNAAPTDSPQHWQLVEMRDLGASSVQALRAIAGTQRTTWGRVKALYR